MHRYAIAILVLLAAQVLAGSSSAQQMDKAGLPIVSGALTVADAVSTALKNHPAVVSGAAGLEAAKARVGISKAMMRPQVSATLTGTTGSMPMVLAGPEGVSPQKMQLAPGKARASQNLMLMYPIFTGGRLRTQVDGSKALADAAGSDAAVSELDVALAARLACYGVMLSRRYVDSYQQRAKESAERVRIAEESLKAGRIAKFDLLRNQADLAESERMLNDAKRDLDIAVIDLKAAMGVSPDSNVSVAGELAFEEPQRSPDDLRSVALAQRPEIAAAAARVRAAEATVAATRGQYAPQVYATAMQDFLRTHGDGSENGYVVGVTAALPIVDGGRRRSEVREAQAMLEQTKAAERAAAIAVGREVDTAIAQMNAATRNVELAKAAVAQADEDYRVVRLRYESGKSVNVEVLDALALTTRAQTGYSEALYRRSVAQAELARAVGQM